MKQTCSEYRLCNVNDSVIVNLIWISTLNYFRLKRFGASLYTRRNETGIKRSVAKANITKKYLSEDSVQAPLLDII